MPLFLKTRIVTQSKNEVPAELNMAMVTHITPDAETGRLDLWLDEGATCFKTVDRKLPSRWHWWRWRHV